MITEIERYSINGDFYQYKGYIDNYLYLALQNKKENIIEYVRLFKLDGTFITEKDLEKKVRNFYE